MSNIEAMLDAAESTNEFTAVDAGNYRLRVISPKTKVISRNGIRSLGLSLAPVATETGEPINGAAIYHTLPLEGEFQQKNKDGSTTTQSRAIFFLGFVMKAFGLDRDNAKAVFESALATAVDSEAQLTLANGEYLTIAGAEVMGKIAITEKDGKQYRNVKSVWPVKAE